MQLKSQFRQPFFQTVQTFPRNWVYFHGNLIDAQRQFQWHRFENSILTAFAIDFQQCDSFEMLILRDLRERKTWRGFELITMGSIHSVRGGQR